MGKIIALAKGLAIGALGMYFYDPDLGNRRRALVRDKVRGLVNENLEAKDRMIRDARNRLTGFLYKTKSKFMGRDPSDQQLVERIRSAIGHVISTPASILVEANCGHVRIMGTILESEKEALIDAVWATDGVDAIEHLLDFQKPGDEAPAQTGDIVVEHRNGHYELTSAAALTLGVAGGLLAVYGLTRKGAVGKAMAIAGLSLVTKSVRDH